MENDQNREKLHVVWASVFLTAFAMWAMTMMLYVGNRLGSTLPIAIAMMISLILSPVVVTLLLSVSGSSAVLLARGRTLLCLQAFCLVLALVIGVIQMS
jgi:hypothetical protein